MIVERRSQITGSGRFRRGRSPAARNVVAPAPGAFRCVNREEH